MNVLASLLIGWLAGYVVNYLADVLPQDLVLGRPSCPECGTGFSWRDYALLRPCTKCGRSRGARTLLVHLALTVASAYIFLAPPQTLGYALGLLTLVYFAVVAVIDIEHRLILHVVSAAGAVLGLGEGILARGLVPTLIGGFVGAAVMFGLYALGTVFARYRARKLGVTDDEEALGFGDVTLGAVLGLFLGWPLIWIGLILGILVGGLVSLVIMAGLIALRRYHALNSFTAYGPFLICGSALLIYFPQQISTLLPK